MFSPFHSIGFHYPIHPNKVSKKKYYDLVMNIPIFLPSERLGNHFSKLLDKYPVTPYLDSRESFIKWGHFIHNRMNELLGLKSCKVPLPHSSFQFTIFTVL